MSVVINGAYKGKTLHELIEIMGESLLGHGVESDAFPLLVKIIDAKKDLSVQVHPNNDNAHLTGGEAKTEMWYVLDAEPKSVIYAGLKPGVTRQSFEKAVAENKLEPVLASIPAAPGRTVFVPGGRVHAIGAGCLLLEVQQNSNTTYRVYDWGRTGVDGKPRELHLEKALQVIDWENYAPQVIPPALLESRENNQLWQVIDSPFFRINRMELRDSEEVSHDGSSFHILFVAKGSVLIGANGVMASAEAGTSCLIPAAAADYTVMPLKGAASVIQISL
jgi:mannose-6-phosphate isomerase